MARYSALVADTGRFAGCRLRCSELMHTPARANTSIPSLDGNELKPRALPITSRIIAPSARFDTRPQFHRSLHAAADRIFHHEGLVSRAIDWRYRGRERDMAGNFRRRRVEDEGR